MNKELEKLSALYDGELTHEEMQENLKKLNLDEDLKKTFHRFGIISELVQRKNR